MRLNVLRSTVLVSAAAMALSACGGQSTVPLQQSGAINNPMMASSGRLILPPGATFALGQISSDQFQPDKKKKKKKKSPCNLGSSMWYFKGSCVEKTGIKSGKGVTIALPAYKGITLADATGQIAVTKPPDTLIVGEGTNSTDITNELGGSKPFPFYSNNCINGGGSAVKCPKAMVYFDNVNYSKTASITFNYTPGVTLTNAAKKKDKCQLGVLLNFSTGQQAWLQTGIGAKSSKKGLLKIGSVAWTSLGASAPNLGPGYFMTWAVGCSK